MSEFIDNYIFITVLLKCLGWFQLKTTIGFILLPLTLMVQFSYSILISILRDNDKVLNWLWAWWTWNYLISISGLNTRFVLQVTGVMTQGRGDGEEWVTSFMVSYSMDAFHWQYVTDTYGNQKVKKSSYGLPKCHNLKWGCKRFFLLRYYVMVVLLQCFY